MRETRLHTSVKTSTSHAGPRLAQQEVVRTMGNRNAVLLRGHGGTVVAANLDNLLRLGINLVRNARIQIMASGLGPAKTLSDEEAESIVSVERGGRPHRRFFDFYLSEVLD